MIEDERFMEKEIIKQDISEDNAYKSLLPEIAELLGVSVSMLESYPTDLQMIICKTYIDNCQINTETVVEALNSIINLDIHHFPAVEKQAQPDILAEKKADEYNKNLQEGIYISRQQILNNSKLISEQKSMEPVYEEGKLKS